MAGLQPERHDMHVPSLFVPVFNSLRTNKSLTMLDISNNSIGM